MAKLTLYETSVAGTIWAACVGTADLYLTAPVDSSLADSARFVVEIGLLVTLGIAMIVASRLTLPMLPNWMGRTSGSTRALVEAVIGMGAATLVSFVWQAVAISQPNTPLADLLMPNIEIMRSLSSLAVEAILTWIVAQATLRLAANAWRR